MLPPKNLFTPLAPILKVLALWNFTALNALPLRALPFCALIILIHGVNRESNTVFPSVEQFWAIEQGVMFDMAKTRRITNCCFQFKV